MEKVMEVMEFKELKRVRTLLKLTTPLYTHFSPALPLT